MVTGVKGPERFLSGISQRDVTHQLYIKRNLAPETRGKGVIDPIFDNAGGEARR
ncbi:uncharacterized protein G2W53_018787 [Senna tora]|uniref:Uncharacterized protein n=1 Tax=Senna tora TaxID=362788 RepID=A0A834TSJ7_9FABA|nr:uncharacterized protein G2W53_018787 [Senna tora]